jgi:hypothetical protein
MTPGEIWIESLALLERERLGLGAEERLLALEISRSHVTLARVRAGESLPARGRPTLRAELTALPLATLLEALHGAARSGLLHYEHRDHAKWIYLSRGEVVFAASNQRVDRLGECLLRAGVLTLEQLREAERRFSPPERFGKVLVEHGFLTPRELWNGVKYQVEEIVRSLFAMPAGTVWFWEGELQPDNVVRLSLETRRLVAEGIQRSEELPSSWRPRDPCSARTGLRRSARWHGASDRRGDRGREVKRCASSSASIAVWRGHPAAASGGCGGWCVCRPGADAGGAGRADDSGRRGGLKLIKSCARAGGGGLQHW